MTFYKKILLCNIVRHHSKYSYVLFCLICVFYFVIYARFNQPPKLNINFETQVRDSLSTSSTTNPPNSTLTKQNKQNLPLKYILLWTNPDKYPFVYFGNGNSGFINKQCQWTNCFVTADRELLGSYTDFDVIVFNAPQLPQMLYSRDWPRDRLPRQKYVFASVESAANVAFRTKVFNGFFNWTWTYKLNSDVVWGYVVVKDANNNVIGPQKNMHWINEKDMAAISADMKLKLKTKDKAVAWMCSSSISSSRREEYVRNLEAHLTKYNFKVDIYSTCGDHQTSKDVMEQCLKVIKKRYYFYLAFENSFSDDYVTEKVLYALNYDTVPIVYGGANYSRFLPPGSYLDAAKLGPKMLAKVIADLINTPLAYSQFFRWQPYYFIHAPHDSPKTDSYCNFCAMINNETLMNKHSSYNEFNVWWMYKVMKVL